MSNSASLIALEQVFNNEKNVDQILLELMKAIAETLAADRCFLYVRDPKTRLGKVAFCFCRDQAVPDLTGDRFKPDSFGLEVKDPLFAAALSCRPTVFVNDVETADPQVVNRNFEKEQFGHRALIQAHVCSGGNLWGILQPCVFGRSRQWTDSDRQLIEMAVNRATPLVRRYVQQEISKIGENQ
ncbi:MAG: GAF domain-containing protein [Waterburya sp.]